MQVKDFSLQQSFRLLTETFIRRGFRNTDTCNMKLFATIVPSVVLNGQVSTWKNINAGVPQGSILGPLLFLIYINDLTEGLTTNVKLFADDTSLFSVVHDTQTSANDLNKDLKIINNWAFQWKMNFNPDPTKQAHEVIFSRKTKEIYHPPLVFNNTSISQSSSQNHL